MALRLGGCNLLFCLAGPRELGLPYITSLRLGRGEPARNGQELGGDAEDEEEERLGPGGRSPAVSPGRKARVTGPGHWARPWARACATSQRRGAQTEDAQGEQCGWGAPEVLLGLLQG